MNCVKCGAHIDGGARFCGACGSAQPAPDPAAQKRPQARTVFQGSGSASRSGPAVPPGGTPPAGTPAPKNPLGYAATIAPGSTPIETADSRLRTLSDAPAPVLPEPADSPLRTISDSQRLQPQPAAATPAPVHSPAAVASTVAAPPAAAPARPVITPVAKKPVADLVGQTLNGRYLVEQKIGEGGFGAVYRARQTQMGRIVALKVLHPKMAKDAQIVGRFKREAQASSLLRAPNTVQVYDFDQTPEGVMYLAMELLQGKSLHSLLYENGPFDPVRVARVLAGIALSLQEAHQQGIVHRDIKPENIYLEPRPEPEFVKVLDFGIAKIVSGESGLHSGPALTAAGQTLGTLEYMSPEQLMGAQLDGRSDLYAVGILGYEILTGKLPFEGRTPAEMITGHLKTIPAAPSTRNPATPPLLDFILLKLLEKKRENRYKDANELIGDLKRVVEGETQAPSTARPVAQPFAAQPTPTPTPPGQHPPTDKVQAIPLAKPNPLQAPIEAGPTGNHPVGKSGGSPMVLILVITLLLAGVGAAAWFFLLRGR